MKRTLISFILLGLLLAACGPNAAETAQQTAVADSILQQVAVKQTEMVLALTPTITPTSSLPTETPPPPATATPTPTPTWIPHTQGEYIIAPILLYHHIMDKSPEDRYDVSLEKFNAQMQALQSWGYTSITVSTLADAIRNGGTLPEKPLLITFDDGDIDVYENAFPIMKQYGFVGTFYIVANRVGADQFVSADQIKEMHDYGWEIGSHGYSHRDMSKDHDVIYGEGYEAKVSLQDKLGFTINTFAFPYGGWDATVASFTAGYGYTSGAGLGNSYIHSANTLYYLSRMEVWGTDDMNMFSARLPWSPVTTPVPLPEK
jgi:peptidoglycan/xylan/chitin deacetylase (PgdA/CDA1 family)